jgi:membrane-associated phospholipid phosphatase
MSEPGERSSPLEPALRFLRNRLSRESYLGLHLTLGLVVALLACWIFADIAEDIQPNEPLVTFDLAVTAWFQAHASASLTSAAWVVTTLGSVGFVTAAALLVAFLFLVRKRWGRLIVFAFTMLGGSALNIALKHFFHRQRPVLENPLVTLSSYGFPSGHTMGATLLYGFLALIAVHSWRTWGQRALTAFSAALLIVAVGVSRIYLGAHYFTDVVGAMAAAAAWLAVCWTTGETIRRRRLRRVPGSSVPTPG